MVYQIIDDEPGCRIIDVDEPLIYESEIIYIKLKNKPLCQSEFEDLCMESLKQIKDNNSREKEIHISYAEYLEKLENRHKEKENRLEKIREEMKVKNPYLDRIKELERSIAGLHLQLQDWLDKEKEEKNEWI